MNYFHGSLNHLIFFINSKHVYYLHSFVNTRCINHLESDLDLEILAWPEAEELIKLSKNEILQNKVITDKIEKKIEIWGKYISTLLARCRAKVN